MPRKKQIEILFYILLIVALFTPRLRTRFVFLLAQCLEKMRAAAQANPRYGYRREAVVSGRRFWTRLAAVEALGLQN